MFKKITILILSLFILSCGDGLTYEQKVKKYNYYTKKSDSLIEIQEYTQALSYINAAIKITDTVPIAFYLKGFASYKLNLLEEAEDNFSIVIKMEGANSKTYKDRAKVYLKNGDRDFLDDINIHIKNYPNDEEALVLRREYFEKRQDFKGAINEYSIAIEKNKNDIGLLTKRADLYFKNGAYVKSIQDYKTLLKLESNNDFFINRKSEIEKLISYKSNRNKFIYILLGIYLIYLPISFFVLRPLVVKKAQNQIGGKFKIKLDPLIWSLPIILFIIFVVSYYMDFIPTISNFKL